MTWLRVKSDLIELLTNLLVSLRLYRRPLPPPDANLKGQTIVVTGSNRGIGLDVVKELVSRQAKVIMVCRDTKVAEKVASDIKSTNPSADIKIYSMDLSDFDSIRSCVETIRKNHDIIDVLVNNAGMVTGTRKDTKDGLEIQMAVNYFGTVLFTLLLLDSIKKSSFGRILFLSSLAHLQHPRVKVDDLNWKNGPYDIHSGFEVYGHTKLTLMLFLQKFASKILTHGIRTYAIDPGMSPTDIARDLIEGSRAVRIAFRILAPFMRTVRSSATSVVKPILFSKDTPYDSQKFYYADGHVKEMSPVVKDGEDCEKLWEITKDTLSMRAIMDNL